MPRRARDKEHLTALAARARPEYQYRRRQPLGEWERGDYCSSPHNPRGYSHAARPHRPAGSRVLHCIALAAVAAGTDMGPDLPIAYLITFRCYGTWLHGDERGSTDRHQNQYGAPFIPPNDHWHGYNARRIKQPPVNLTDAQRECVEAAIRETCEFHNWTLLAINARTNHVHNLVASGSTQPSRVLNALKTHATQLLREANLWQSPRSPWSERGSKRYVWTELGIERAKEYVIKGQDGPIPMLDEPNRRRGVTQQYRRR